MKKLTILFLILFISVSSWGVDVPWIDARDYHDGNYNDYDGAAITGALNAAGPSEKTIFLAAGMWYITHSITIPSNITLKFEHGAILKISGGRTLTINGNIESSVRQIFSGDGTVKLGSLVKEAYPQWWGNVGTVNDNNVCQAALDSGAATIRFLPGTYNILPHDPQIIEYGGLQPKSNTTLIFEQGSKLKAITNDRAHYAVLNIKDVKNVKIYGPTIEGDRKTHTGTTGEWGMGILIQDQSKGIVIKDANVYDCWGDGICIGGGTQEDVYVENSIFDNNRRQGCSITNARNVLFKKCTFSNTNGTSPQNGVDVEADYAGDYIQNIVFEDCRSYNNAATGFGIAKDGPLNNPFSVTFRGCTSYGDSTGFGIAQGPSDTNGGMVFITDCYSINARSNGFATGSANLPVTINGLTVINPNQDGLDESWARYASGLVVLMMDDNRLAGNVTARNVHVESTDGKAIKALCLHHFSSQPNSGIENIDIELTTNMPSNKRFFKADSVDSFKGYCRVRFPDNPVYNATGNVSSTEAVKYIGQTITNQGAAGNITVVLTAPASVSNGSEFTFEVKSPYRITLAMSGYPLLPGNKTSYYSTTVGDRLKVRADGSNWYIVEQIGTWQ
ncbi:MAG: hypothetical protein A2Y10_10595 [Planctomycetes bacterium GWF2_41_51]|nr:MAG: hypothetical protein A2Y10_10595 [Planctomycetes bacterium GWF2_41_51]HBG26924.1 hypothetical protein [Phycisphaerales bacterium]